jgi:hypothetical protein
VKRAGNNESGPVDRRLDHKSINVEIPQRETGRGVTAAVLMVVARAVCWSGRSMAGRRRSWMFGVAAVAASLAVVVPAGAALAGSGVRSAASRCPVLGWNFNPKW